MTLAHTRHDSLFRLLTEDASLAAALLQDILPPGVITHLNLNHLPGLVPGTFIDEDGAASQTDTLLRVRLKSGGDAFLYVLFEHKSHVDPTTPIQLLRYMTNIWEKEVEERNAPTDPLSQILPIVVYAGKAKWTVPRSFDDIIQVPNPSFRNFARMTGTYILHDLSSIPHGKLSHNPKVRSALIALEIAHKTDIDDEALDLIFMGITSPEHGILRDRLCLYILKYIASNFAMREERIAESLTRIKIPAKQTETIMTTAADIWMAEGEARGEARGRAIGAQECKRNLFIKMVKQRYGALPETARAMITKAEGDQLDAWIDAYLNLPNEMPDLESLMATGISRPPLPLSS